MHTILCGDALVQLATLQDKSIQTCITSPPYFGLRSYLAKDHPDKKLEIGTENIPQEYINKLVTIFREVRRVLKDDGTVWLNLGDSHARDASKGQHKPGQAGIQSRIYDTGSGRSVALHFASESKGSSDDAVGRADRAPVRNGDPNYKPKDLLMIPARVALALQADGWYLRSDIVWAKLNPVPESVRDRPTRSHEFIFLLSKKQRYFYDHLAIKEPAVKNSIVRNKRDVWNVAVKPYRGAGSHFATFPIELILPCVLAGSRPGDTVLDIFAGSGTVGEAAIKHGRNCVLIELNSNNIPLILDRLRIKIPMPSWILRALKKAAIIILKQLEF